MGSRKRQSVSVTGLRNRQSVSVTQTSSSLTLLRRLDCLFLKPVTETHCLFFRTLYPDNFIEISWFKGEGAKNDVFYLEYTVQEGYLFPISKFYLCDRVPLIYEPRDWTTKMQHFAVYENILFSIFFMYTGLHSLHNLFLPYNGERISYPGHLHPPQLSTKQPA